VSALWQVDAVQQPENAPAPGEAESGSADQKGVEEIRETDEEPEAEDGLVPEVLAFHARRPSRAPQ